MISNHCINCKHTDYDYNKCAGCNKSHSQHPPCPYLDEENVRDYKEKNEDYDDVNEEEIQSDKM